MLVYIMDFILLCWLCLSDSYILFIMKTTHLGHYLKAQLNNSKIIINTLLV